MKTVLVSLTALLMVSGAAFGAGTITITGPGGVGLYEPTPGTAFEITVTIQTDQPLQSWQGFLQGPAGATMRNDRNLAGTVYPSGGGYNNYADTYNWEWSEDDEMWIFVGWSNSAGWDTNNGLTWGPDGDPSTTYYPIGGPGIEIGTIAADDVAGSNSGFVFKNQVKVTAAEGMITLGGNIKIGSMDFQNIAADYTVVPLLLPEPISALLLLAGLPMLRRRR